MASSLAAHGMLRWIRRRARRSCPAPNQRSDPETAQLTVEASPRAAAVGMFRWRICAMLLAATTINYIDRQVLGVLAPFLQESIGWNEIEYGYIVSAFQAAYAIGLLGAGAIIDRFGTRIGYALAIGVWSVAAVSHAFATSVLGFAAARFALGLGEAGNFPAAIKVVAEWFPRRERALATGIFNSGSNIGAIVAPLLVPVIATRWGWQAAFLFTGVLSASWLTWWLLSYRAPEQHPRLSPTELGYIRGDRAEASARVAWRAILMHRQAWAFVAAKFLTDPVWWFFLFWLPKFLHAEYGLTLLGLGAPLIAIFVSADVGSIAGGWLAGHLIKRGWSVKSRAQERDGGVRARRRADRFRSEGGQPVDRGRVDRSGHCRSPGLVGQRVHARLGPVSASRRGLRRRSRRICRRRRRDADRDFRRIPAAGDRQLRARFHHGRIGVPAGACSRARADATTRTGNTPEHARMKTNRAFTMESREQHKDRPRRLPFFACFVAFMLQFLGPASIARAEPLATGLPKFLGSAYSAPQARDFASYWNQVTPENAGKWGNVEAVRGKMDWTALDEAYRFAKSHGFVFHYHVLVWGQQQPEWLRHLPTAQQRTAIEHWFDAVAQRYPDADFVEVVNEPLHHPPEGDAKDAGNYIAALGGKGASGWDWMLDAFRMARARFPHAKLMINDYSITNTPADAQRYREIVDLLLREKLLDAIGIQGHAFSTTLEAPVATHRAALDLLAASGLPIYVNELDIDGPSDAKQLEDFQRVFPMFWEHPAVQGVTLWGFRPGLWRDKQRAYLVRKDGSERPALMWLRGYVLGVSGP